MPNEIRTILKNNPIVPVIILDREEDAVPLAHALLAGGIRTMEITLRTKAALPAIARVAKEVPEMAVGAGTVVDAKTYTQAVSAGAQYLISPGLTPPLAVHAFENPHPFLPGTTTASDIMFGLEHGFTAFKFFPAAVMGGPVALKHYAAVFPAAVFCPTGGIDAKSAPEYLTLPNVLAVGGSWVTPKAALDARDWSKITQLAKEGLSALHRA